MRASGDSLGPGSGDAFDLLTLCGSLRRESYNRALLTAAQELAPSRMGFREFAIAGLPAYDADLDETFDAGPYPAAVRDLRQAVTGADAVLIVSPEYNWGPPGFLKNALDWLSRPAGRSPLHRKPIALMGTSPGPAGTMRGQLQLRQNLTAVRSYPLPEPDVYLGRAASLFDDSLRLVDERSRTLVRAQLDALIEWTMRHEVRDAEAKIGVSE